MTNVRDIKKRIPCGPAHSGGQPKTISEEVQAVPRPLKSDLYL